MAMCDEKRPRIGAIVCNTVNKDGTVCSGVCYAYSSHALVTYCRCEVCNRTKKVTRPRPDC